MKPKKTFHVFFILMVIGQHVLKTYNNDSIEMDEDHTKDDEENTTHINNQKIVKKLKVARNLGRNISETLEIQMLLI